MGGINSESSSDPTTTTSDLSSSSSSSSSKSYDKHNYSLNNNNNHILKTIKDLECGATKNTTTTSKDGNSSKVSSSFETGSETIAICGNLIFMRLASHIFHPLKTIKSFSGSLDDFILVSQLPSTPGSQAVQTILLQVLKKILLHSCDPFTTTNDTAAAAVSASTATNNNPNNPNNNPNNNNANNQEQLGGDTRQKIYESTYKYSVDSHNLLPLNLSTARVLLGSLNGRRQNMTSNLPIICMIDENGQDNPRRICYQGHYFLSDTAGDRLKYNIFTVRRHGEIDDTNNNNNNNYDDETYNHDDILLLDDDNDDNNLKIIPLPSFETLAEDFQNETDSQFVEDNVNIRAMYHLWDGLDNEDSSNTDLSHAQIVSEWKGDENARKIFSRPPTNCSSLLQVFGECGLAYSSPANTLKLQLEKLHSLLDNDTNEGGMEEGKSSSDGVEWEKKVQQIFDDTCYQGMSNDSSFQNLSAMAFKNNGKNDDNDSNSDAIDDQYRSLDNLVNTPSKSKSSNNNNSSNNTNNSSNNKKFLRNDLDFSERLWETLINFDGKKKVLQMVFSTLKRGVVLPVIDRGNTTYLGNYLRTGAKMVQLQRYESKANTPSKKNSMQSDSRNYEWQWITNGRKITEGSSDNIMKICAELGIYKLQRDFKWWFLTNIQLSEVELSWYLMGEEQEDFSKMINSTDINDDDDFKFDDLYINEAVYRLHLLMKVLEITILSITCGAPRHAVHQLTLEALWYYANQDINKKDNILQQQKSEDLKHPSFIVSLNKIFPPNIRERLGQLIFWDITFTNKKNYGSNQPNYQQESVNSNDEIIQTYHIVNPISFMTRSSIDEPLLINRNVIQWAQANLASASSLSDDNEDDKERQQPLLSKVLKCICKSGKLNNESLKTAVLKDVFGQVSYNTALSNLSGDSKSKSSNHDSRPNIYICTMRSVCEEI